MGMRDKWTLLLENYIAFNSDNPESDTLIYVTANVVLTGEVYDSKSFSIFYGQSYSLQRTDIAETDSSLDLRDSAEFGYSLAGPYLISDVSDLGKIPIDITEEEVISAFEERKIHLGSKSGCSVEMVVNLVVLMRKNLRDARKPFKKARKARKTQT